MSWANKPNLAGEVVIPILHPNVSKEMARFFGVR
jgi:hypothetical protein